MRSATAVTSPTTTPTAKDTPVIAIHGVRSLRPRAASCASSFGFSTALSTSVFSLSSGATLLSYPSVRPPEPRRYDRRVITKPDRLHYTGDDEADRLIADEPLALMIGFVLDQQVPLQKAFSSPLELKRRLGGSLDAAAIAGMEPAALERAFTEKPALHRFPGAMARRTQDFCAAVVSDYGGRVERVWDEAVDAADLKRRLLDLPGIGPMKAGAILAVLGKLFGIKPPGWYDVAPQHPTLGDVDSPEALERFQEAKRAYKARLKAASE